jgi:uncharacterized protein (DUF58 family)
MARNVTLTRRGRAVVGVCLACVLLGWMAGARSLNAVLLPGLIGLAAGYLQVARLDPPAVRRELPPDDFAGSTHDVTLRFRGRDGASAPARPFLASVWDGTSDGLAGPAGLARTTVGEAPVTYEVRYERRGRWNLGPVTLAATDVFGLVERSLVCPDRDTVTVYPERHPVPSWFRRELYHDEALGPSRQRGEFDRLREYERGDPLRDIHWRTTAKRDELIVKEFAAESEQRRVRIAAGADGGGGDAMASATASVALALLGDGVPVAVAVPGDSVDARPTGEDRRRLLELLATAGTGPVPDGDADVTVSATPRRTTVTLGEEAFRFERLREAAVSEAEPAEAGAGIGDREAADRDGNRADAAVRADGGSRPERSGSNPDRGDRR